jgi:preprotein translocase SecE subunit
MAKTRQQRKAEKRARERLGVDRARDADSEAQARTQVPKSGEVAEAEVTLAELKQEAVPEPAAVEAKPARAKARPKDKERKAPTPTARKQAPPAERQRGRVLSFLASCWAELKRVQWPDRPTVLQATAVVLIFVAVAAAYLGALDAVFGRLVKAVL